ncbi:hypothetical protein [Halalkalicoccus salilacus]|uniref:hypothetical protein n=1 Tax=Halalkalicoccus sp. GCM10025704 TaxID=3252662 RepID=UPI00361F1FC9
MDEPREVEVAVNDVVELAVLSLVLGREPLPDRSRLLHRNAVDERLRVGEHASLLCDLEEAPCELRIGGRRRHAWYYSTQVL